MKMDISNILSFQRWVVICMTLVIHRTLFSCQETGLIPSSLFVEIQRALPEAMHVAQHMLTDTLRMESKYAHHMKRLGKHGRRSSPFHGVSGFLGLTPEAKRMSYPAFVQLKTVELVRARFRLDNAQVLELMNRMTTPLKMNMVPFFPDSGHQATASDMCPYPQNIVCDQSATFRTYDGCCNNLEKPLFGAAFQPLARFLPPQYADAIGMPRVSVTGAPLPSPRLVSSTIHWDIDRPMHLHTHFIMLFGQFVDHDMSRTAITKLTTHPSGLSDDLEDVECGDTGCDTEGLENQACLPIAVPRNDSDFGYGKKEGGCLMFVRSLEVPYASNCRLGPREQLNQLTSWLDASLIYGSTRKGALGLRDLSIPDRGRLKMVSHPAGDYKPLLQKDPDFKDCMQSTEFVKCFKAGDGRVNENVALTTVHTYFAREHNRIETILNKLNPHWGGERLYQETRRILTAIWVHTIYNEYLPLILGKQNMDREGLTLTTQGPWNEYDSTVNPNIGNVFATAAFRFGHSQIQGMLNMKDREYKTKQTIPLDLTFRFPHLMYKEPQKGCDELMRGFISDPAQTRDPFMTKQITRHLFAEEPPHGLGTDLMSLNMQRAREHGLPGYNFYREWCGLKKAKTFDDLQGDLPYEVVDRFKRLYAHVDDIDIFPAGVSENSYPGAILGPTFSCILARQFKRLKFGDRFWYENNAQNPYPFTANQLQEIRKSSIAKIMCNNGDTMTNIQPRVLLQPFSTLFNYLRDSNKLSEIQSYNSFYFADHNERTPCNNLPDLDFRAWQEIIPTAPNTKLPPPLPRGRSPQPTHVHPNAINRFSPNPRSAGRYTFGPFVPDFSQVNLNSAHGNVPVKVNVNPG